MIPYLVNGESVNIPSSWPDVKFNQWKQLTTVKDNDNIKIASIMLNMDEQDLRKAKFENVEALYQALEFISEPCQIVSEPVEVMGYKIPKDITFESLGQFEDMRTTFNEALSKLVTKEDGTIDVFNTIPAIAEYFPTWIAIYIQKERDGEYDYEKALSMICRISEASCIEVISAGTFFFYKLITLFAPIRKTSLNPSPQ